MFEMLACVMVLVAFFAVIGIFVRLGRIHKAMTGEEDREAMEWGEEKKRQEAQEAASTPWILVFIFVVLLLYTFWMMI